MFYVWLGVFIILLIIEIVTFNFITIWFAVGAIAAMISTLFLADTYIQAIIFVCVSTIALIATRPLVKKYLKKEPEKTNLDMVVGKVGIVTEEIGPLNPGEVKIGGKRWTAISKEKISVGSKVEILKIEGVKLVVKKETNSHKEEE